MSKERKAIVTFASTGEINTKDASEFIIDIINSSDNQPNLGRVIKVEILPDKMDEELKELLKNISYVFNAIPNQRKVGRNGEDSYDLASKLGKYMKKYEILNKI